ncbi:MAG: hypothetical protein EBU34_14060, partial [Alphaproteobacteria bacterium]|nr:hypothetical protein [Alphaproteobacteria bacterium]
MSDNKDNPPINLELLERQLREALARRPSDAGQERTGTQSAEDPLAELSRLSGFENPSRSEQVVSAPVFRQALPNQSVHSDHFELQAVGDQYGVQPQFSQPKRPQEPVAESIPSGNSQSSQLFQSISVNYGGFQNQSMLTPQDMPVTPPAFLGFQSTNQPITQQNPHQAD